MFLSDFVFFAVLGLPSPFWACLVVVSERARARRGAAGAAGVAGAAGETGVAGAAREGL